MNESAVRGLCSAIILQAIADFGKSLHYIRTHDSSDDPVAYYGNLKRYDECRRFFLSDWFSNINPTSLSGGDMLASAASNPEAFKTKIRSAFYGIQ